MNLNWLLFSHEGRLNRQRYWTTLLALGASNLVICFVALMIDSSGLLSLLCSTIVSLISIMPNIKRLHDRNRSGWYLLLLIVPLVNIWIAIEIGFIKGTEGENRFGADPLAKPISKIEEDTNIV